MKTKQVKKIAKVWNFYGTPTHFLNTSSEAAIRKVNLLSIHCAVLVFLILTFSIDEVSGSRFYMLKNHITNFR